jgi:phosphate transport system substrate-binding protein
MNERPALQTTKGNLDTKLSLTIKSHFLFCCKNFWWVRGGFVFILALALTFSACTEHKPVAVKEEKAVSGYIDSVTIYCDEAFRYLIDQEISIYETGQPDRHIHIVYLPESEVQKHLFADSFATVIIGRRLHEQERADLLHKNNVQVDERTFATDAIAIIANPSFEKNTLPYASIISLLSNASHDYNLVFEGNGSGVINYMFSQIAHTSARPSAYAAKNMDELVSYLQKDKSSIGFIPFSRISDENDTAARHLLKKVKVLYVSRPDSTGKLISSTASQSEIADGSYPLDRPINFISHTMDENVGMGFANFLFKDQSGRIILKSGLVPAIMPQRVINVNTNRIE